MASDKTKKAKQDCKARIGRQGRRAEKADTCQQVRKSDVIHPQIMDAPSAHSQSLVGDWL